MEKVFIVRDSNDRRIYGVYRKHDDAREWVEKAITERYTQGWVEVQLTAKQIINGRLEYEILEMCLE